MPNRRGEPTSAAPAGLRGTETDFQVIDEAFCSRETVIVARDLLGCTLVHSTSTGDVGGIIVETEAYGPNDPASHAFRGKTRRNEAMFGPPATAYVYLCYGLHTCLNVVRPCGIGEAVLIRALEPTIGVGSQQQNRRRQALRDLCSGPGRLCQALGVGLDANGTSLTTGMLRVFERGAEPMRIVATRRIGTPSAPDLTWRFCIADSPFLSRGAGHGR